MQSTTIRLMIYPRDFARARDFYENILQLPIHKFYEADSVIMFALGNSNIVELLPREAGKDQDFRFKASLEVPDVRALWESLQSKVEVVFVLRHNAWGDDSFCIADTEGNHLTFFTPYA